MSCRCLETKIPLTVTRDRHALDQLESICPFERRNLAIRELGRECSRFVREIPIRLLQLQVIESSNAEDLRTEIRTNENAIYTGLQSLPEVGEVHPRKFRWVPCFQRSAFSGQTMRGLK